MALFAIFVPFVANTTVLRSSHESVHTRFPKNAPSVRQRQLGILT